MEDLLPYLVEHTDVLDALSSRAQRQREAQMAGIRQRLGVLQQQEQGQEPEGQQQQPEQGDVRPPQGGQQDTGGSLVAPRPLQACPPGQLELHPQPSNPAVGELSVGCVAAPPTADAAGGSQQPAAASDASVPAICTNPLAVAGCSDDSSGGWSMQAQQSVIEPSMGLALAAQPPSAACNADASASQGVW